MTIDAPKKDQIPLLRLLWKETFGDSDRFLDSFFSMAFSPARSRCVTENGEVKAALYWFDCCCRGEQFAYLYAVATAERYRGQGLCRKLLENTHTHLYGLGYAGVILVPATDGLRKMYGTMGYLPGTTVTEFTCQPGEIPVQLRQLTSEEYAALRREMLPADGVEQNEVFAALLGDLCGLYAGEGFLMAVYVEDSKVYAEELLGDASAAPGILRAMGAEEGSFRTPGEEKDFAMYCPLRSSCPKPGYFGISFG